MSNIRCAEVHVLVKVAGFDFSNDDWVALTKELADRLGDSTYQYAQGKAPVAMTYPAVSVVHASKQP